MPVKRDDASTALAILKRLSEESPKGIIVTSFFLTRQFKYLDILTISVKNTIFHKLKKYKYLKIHHWEQLPTESPIFSKAAYSMPS